MPFTNPPPIRADALEFTHDRQGRLVSAKFSQSWLRWFASFREQVEAVAALSLAELQDELGALSQDNVNSIGAAAFGDDYKGAWSARTHNVGNVRSYEGRYYRCIVARLAANVETPDNDPQGWELSGSAANLSLISQNNVEAIGAATFADAYKGKWAAGVHAVGDVRSYLLRYYECLVARVAADIGNPTVDVTSWDLAGSAITIKANIQENVDAFGYATYGNRYKGKWKAGVYDVDDYSSSGGRYYKCLVARTAANTDDPSVDNAGWEAVGSSFVLQGNITTAKQENIDAAARIVFGDDYKGLWKAGAFAVGDVSYDNVTEKFYECDTARTAANTTRPSVNTTAWSLLDALKRDVANSLGLSNLKSQVFTSSGTWTQPANVNFVKVLLIGGGGGGGGGGRGSAKTGGGGGSGGELIFREVAVTANVSVTVGAGGLGGAGETGGTGNDGNDGGDTTFASIGARGGQHGSRGGNASIPELGIGGFLGISESPLGSSIADGGGRNATFKRLLGKAITGFGASPGATPDGTINGFGGGGVRGDGGDGGSGRGVDGGDAADNSGSGGGGGYSDTSSGVSGTDGGDGGSGYAVVYWTE